jgi:hypothetical protein
MKPKNEAKDFLTQFLSRLETDDNRATARPILWCIQKKIVEYYPVWNSGGWWSYPDNEGHYIKADDLEDAIKEYKKFYGSDDAPSEDDFDQWDRIERWEIVQTFLTKEGLDRHVAQNKHNLGEFRDYVIHAHRDPELKELYEAIRTIVIE